MSFHVHSLNNSPSHQKYSFSKEKRFVHNKPTYFLIETVLRFTTCLKLREIVGLPWLVLGKDLYQISMTNIRSIHHMLIAYLQVLM